MSQDSMGIAVDEQTAKELLREMLRSRIFEEEAAERCAEGEIPGYLHLCYGHEGSHAGMGVAMDDDDWLAVGGARLVGQYITKGVPLDKIMAELYGKRAGSNKGHGGAMHVSDVSRGLYGHAATIGSGQNPAVGLALAEQMRGTDNVAVTTIGDGGTTRGSFHSALIFAAFWNLPVVFIIENNQWAISTPSEKLPVESLADYGDPITPMETERIDGSDVQQVYTTVSEAIERARDGGGPTLIESNVARLAGHFQGDREDYRDKAPKVGEEYDPVTNWKERLFDHGIIDETEYAEMKESVLDEVHEAIEYARNSELPDPKEAYEHVLQLPLYGQEENQ